MQAPWNKLELDRPPTTSWRCSANEFDSPGFLKAVNKTIVELESQKILETEAAVLSRLIYRLKSKLRSDKGMKNMEKINRALLNYLKLSLENDYKYLRDNTECDGEILALPSREMLQYTLVRTQGFAKLMCRIENVAKCAGDFFKARISHGQAWNFSIIAYSVISRIWLLARHLTKKSCDWYSRIYKYHDKLTVVGVPWLPKNYEFPVNLKTWLNVPWIDEEIKTLTDKEVTTDSIFSLITREEEVEEDLEIDLDDTKDATVAKLEGAEEKKEVENKIEPPAPQLMEIGERISREAFTTDFPRQTPKPPATKKRKVEASDKIEDVGIPAKRSSKIEKKLADKIEDVGIPAKRSSKIEKKLADKKPKKSKMLSIDELKTKEDVAKFLSLESYPGLDKMQWKMLRKNASKLLLKLNKCDGSSGAKKREILLRKIIHALREWIQ